MAVTFLRHMRSFCSAVSSSSLNSPGKASNKRLYPTLTLKTYVVDVPLPITYSPNYVLIGTYNSREPNPRDR